ncbi:unnamed protein product [Meloidogyne enterolobii]|uniref:Uncharacterized protein n=1 Tax=Meloidogyne enterolobii TaxID=390850 RepID=A0ACB0XQ01_MELEN
MTSTSFGGRTTLLTLIILLMFFAVIWGRRGRILVVFWRIMLGLIIDNLHIFSKKVESI